MKGARGAGGVRGVVLAAGPPHRGATPAPLRGDRGDVPVLDWTLLALGLPTEDVVVVAGYRAADVRSRYPGLRIVDVPDWRETGGGASLLAGLEAVGALGPAIPDELEVLVCYGDVLLREGQAAGLVRGDADAALLWDGAWRDRYAARSRSDLAASEKVVVQDTRLTRAGYDIPVDAASGEFVGLVRLGPRALGAVDDLATADPAAVRRAALSEVMSALVRSGVGCRTIDVAGDWAEVDAPEDIARFVLGTKADTLRRLRGLVRGARIAPQVTVTVEAWRRGSAEQVARVRDELGGGPLIVRSSSSHEDAFAASNAGGFTSVLDVGMDGLGDAVERVIASYVEGGIPSEDLGGQQILVQPMVADVVRSGVATTRTLEHGGPWRVVAFVDGDDTGAVTGGTSDAERTLVVHRGRSPAAPLPPSAVAVGPLLPVLEEVERLLGHDRLDVEFAIDRAGTVHVLQVRPLVTPEAPVDDDVVIGALAGARRAVEALGEAPVLSVMTDWNPAEMIGTAPGALARSLYGRLITDGVWARQRAEYGYRDLRPAPLLVDVAGRPYVDVRRSLGSFLPVDLDDDLADRLLDEALGRLRAEPWRHDKVEFDLVATCLGPDFPRHADRLRATGFRPDEIDDLAAALRAVTRRAIRRVGADRAVVAGLADRRAGLADLAPAERARRLLDDAATRGTLPFAHLARGAFVAMALLRGAVTAGRIPDAAVESFLRTVRTVGQDLAADAAAVAAGALALDDLVRRWGHLRPGTYDVTSPRYDSDPERFLAPLVARARDAVPVTPDPSPRAWLAARPALVAALRADGVLAPEDGEEELERFLRTAVEGREWAKLEFTRNLSDALEALVAAWEPYGLTRAELADLPIDALLVPPSAAGAAELRPRAADGASARRVAARLQLPPVILAPDDVEAFVLTADVPNFVGSERVVAPVARPDELGTSPSDLEGRIVLVPRADPGYDWLFGHGIVGLVTLYGGANSHMAIRAAELGLSAAIGVGEQRYRALGGATLLELDPAGRTIRSVA